jgi:hypothetical protein
MRRFLALAAVFVTGLAACGSPAEPATAPAPSTAATASADVPAMTMDTATACAAADAAYSALGPAAQAQVARGVAAEQKGDKATVKDALAALHPIFTSTAATFADTAGKVSDPDLKAALNSLADAAARASNFTTFTEFQSMAALTAQGEAVLKQKCAAAGYTLKNIE